MEAAAGTDAPAPAHAPAYLEGIRLFNAGHFWHAHEQWEACWHESAAPVDAVFYKGIIQAAAALEHWQRGNPRGLRRNWEKSRAKLAAVPSPYRGLDIGRLMIQMEAFIATTATDPAPVPPVLTLQA